MIISNFLIVFSSVLLHEFGHAFMAQYLGYSIKEIILHVFGGFAVIEGKFLTKPLNLFLIIAAGPLVSFWLAFNWLFLWTGNF